MIEYEQLEELWCLAKDTQSQLEIFCLLRYLEHDELIDCFGISNNVYIQNIKNYIQYYPNLYLDTLRIFK